MYISTFIILLQSDKVALQKILRCINAIILFKSHRKKNELGENWGWGKNLYFNPQSKEELLEETL
jgi:hypothetical protein